MRVGDAEEAARCCKNSKEVGMHIVDERYFDVSNMNSRTGLTAHSKQDDGKIARSFASRYNMIEEGSGGRGEVMQRSWISSSKECSKDQPCQLFDSDKGRERSEILKEMELMRMSLCSCD